MALAYLVTQVHQAIVVLEFQAIPVNRVGPAGPATVVSAATQALPAGLAIAVRLAIQVILVIAVQVVGQVGPVFPAM